jgi:hypothetical protein
MVWLFCRSANVARKNRYDAILAKRHTLERMAGDLQNEPAIWPLIQELIHAPGAQETMGTSNKENTRRRISGPDGNETAGDTTQHKPENQPRAAGRVTY